MGKILIRYMSSQPHSLTQTQGADQPHQLILERSLSADRQFDVGRQQAHGTDQLRQSHPWDEVANRDETECIVGWFLSRLTESLGVNPAWDQDRFPIMKLHQFVIGKLAQDDNDCCPMDDAPFCRS